MTTPNDKDGGAAFPQTESRNMDGPACIQDSTAKIVSRGGMSLRDYFAAKALQGIVASTAHPDCVPLSIKPDKCAEGAYKLADAMLAARTKETPRHD